MAAGPDRPARTGSSGILFRAAVTVLFLALIAWYVDPLAVLERVTNLRPIPILLVALLLGAQLLVGAWRWKLIIDKLSPGRARYADLCRYIGASNLYGQLLPSTVGGDLVRTGMLARDVGLGPATASTMVDRITGLAVLLFLMVAMLPLLAWRIDNPVAVAGLAAFGILATAAFLAAIFLGSRFPDGLMAGIGARIREFSGHVHSVMFGRELALSVSGCGLLAHLASITLIYLMGRAVDVPLAFVDCLLLVPPALLVAAMPISLSGWGVREGALAGTFALVGVPVADMITVSVLYGLTGPAMGLAYGMLTLFERKPPEPCPAPAPRSRDAVARYYDEAAAGWDEAYGEGLNADYNGSRWQSLEPLLAQSAASRSAVELGVGTGVYVARTAPMFEQLFVVDFSQGMLDVLTRKLEGLRLGNVTPLRADACHLDTIADASVDIVYSIGLLDNIDAPQALFREVARILRPGGAFVACTANGRCPWYALRDSLQGMRHHRTGHYLAAGDARRFAEGAGLRLDAVTHWGTVPSGLRSQRLSRILRALERPLARTPLARYLAGLTFRAAKP